VAVVTEERRAQLAERIVALAEKFVERAHELTDRDERLMVARALGLAAEQIRSETSGASKNYNVSLAVKKEYPVLTFDDEGKQIDTSHMLIRSYEEALAVLERGESQGEAALPCDGWSKDSIHSTPTFTEPDPNEPHEFKREENPDYKIDSKARAPSRIDTMPTSDNTGAHGVKRSSTIPVTGL
jgi:hypothetical protein